LSQHVAVDNTLSPHGGKLVYRVVEDKEKAKELAKKAKVRIPVRGQIARECISIAYGFFSPLEGFMGAKDVDSVVHNMTLSSGYVWSIPIVFDMSEEEIEKYGIAIGDSVLFTYKDQPLAIFDVEEMFVYDKIAMAKHVYGTDDEKHPGVKRTYDYKAKFLGGKVTLINPPVFNPPFDRFWYPPAESRMQFMKNGWTKVVAHQTRNVPHTGHEWLMKGAWFAANADAVLVSCVVGEKRKGDYIDECIVLGQAALREYGYFREDVHMTSMILWDMRYAGPREAVFHAIVRKNLGCTHHMFGRDHAGVGDYYPTYGAHEIFKGLPDLGIKSVLTKEWYYCPVCAGIVYEGFDGHKKQKQKFSGTVIRSIIQQGVKPTRLIFRPEVFDTVMMCAEKYGFGSPFVNDNYLENRNPVFTIPPMEV